MDFNQFKSEIYSFSGDSVLYIDSEPDCRLIPVGSWLKSKRFWIEKMVSARATNMDSFFSRFQPSYLSMEKYLTYGAILDPNKILFCLVAKDDLLLGHLGLKMIGLNDFQVDNVMRIEQGYPGIFKEALETILHWNKTNAPLSKYSLEVISTNSRAIRLYEEVGFTVSKRIAMETKLTDDGFLSLYEINHEGSLNSHFKLIMSK